MKLRMVRAVINGQSVVMQKLLAAINRVDEKVHKLDQKLAGGLKLWTVD